VFETGLRAQFNQALEKGAFFEEGDAFFGCQTRRLHHPLEHLDDVDLGEVVPGVVGEEVDHVEEDVVDLEGDEGALLGQLDQSRNKVEGQ